MKNPTLAAVLNFVPGLGYVYVGGERQIFGVMMLIAMAITFATAMIDPAYAETPEESSMDMMYLLVLVSFAAAFMYDAYAAAKSYNAAVSKQTKK